MRIWHWAMGVCLLLLLSISAACSDEQAVRVDLSELEPPLIPTTREAAITYAYLPQYAHAVSHRRHRRLVEYLQEATGLPLRQLFPDTFDQHLKMVARGEIDISFTNPFIYLQMAEHGARAFARIDEYAGGTDFRGQLIVRADNSAINSVADCRNKRWLAVDPASAGGYFFALGLFAEHGLQPSDFAEVAFASGSGKQEQVVLGVYSGAYDVGSIREGTLPLLAERIDLGRLRVLAETPPYPGWLYAARAGLDPEITRRIAAALLQLDPKDPGQAEILQAAGFKAVIPAEDRDYQPFRELVNKLGAS